MVLDALLAVLYNLSVMVLVAVAVSELYRAHSHKKLEKLAAKLHEEIEYERQNRLDNDDLIEKLISGLDGDVADGFALLDEKLDKLEDFKNKSKKVISFTEAPTTKAAKVSTAKSKKSATSKRKK